MPKQMSLVSPCHQLLPKKSLVAHSSPQNESLTEIAYHWSSFVDAVYNIRKDDGKRYKLLMAFVQSQQEENGDTEKESWKLLWDECPWLIHCDTAFGKRRRF